MAVYKRNFLTLPKGMANGQCQSHLPHYYFPFQGPISVSASITSRLKMNLLPMRYSVTWRRLMLTTLRVSELTEFKWTLCDRFKGKRFDYCFYVSWSFLYIIEYAKVYFHILWLGDTDATREASDEDEIHWGSSLLNSGAQISGRLHACGRVGFSCFFHSIAFIFRTFPGIFANCWLRSSGDPLHKENIYTIFLRLTNTGA